MNTKKSFILAFILVVLNEMRLKIIIIIENRYNTENNNAQFNPN